MKTERRIESILLVSVLILATPFMQVVRGTPVTIPYEFVPEQSNVIKTGGITGARKTYSVEGQFQLTVDYDANVVSFTQVDATWGNGFRYSLDELFNMTGLDGTIVSNNILDFEGQTLDFPFDVHLQLTLINPEGFVHLTGGFVQNVPDGSRYDLDAVAVPEPGTFLLLAFGGIMLRRRS